MSNTNDAGFSADFADKVGAARDMTSRYRGVTFNKKSHKWQAVINTSGKHIHLGTFQSEDGAATAFDNAALLVRGKKAKLNFSLNKYCGADGTTLELNPVIAKKLQDSQSPKKLPGRKAFSPDGMTTSPSQPLPQPFKPPALHQQLTWPPHANPQTHQQLLQLQHYQQLQQQKLDLQQEELQHPMQGMGVTSSIDMNPLLMGMSSGGGPTRTWSAGLVQAAGFSQNNSKLLLHNSVGVQQLGPHSVLVGGQEIRDPTNGEQELVAPKSGPNYMTGAETTGPVLSNQGDGPQSWNTTQPYPIILNSQADRLQFQSNIVQPNIEQGGSEVPAGDEMAMWTLLRRVRDALPPGSRLDGIVPNFATQTLVVMYKESAGAEGQSGQWAERASRNGAEDGGKIHASIWQDGKLMGKLSSDNHTEMHIALRKMIDTFAPLQKQRVDPSSGSSHVVMGHIPGKSRKPSWPGNIDTSASGLQPSAADGWMASMDPNSICLSPESLWSSPTAFNSVALPLQAQYTEQFVSMQPMTAFGMVGQQMMPSQNVGSVRFLQPQQTAGPRNQPPPPSSQQQQQQHLTQLQMQGQMEVQLQRTEFQYQQQLQQQQHQQLQQQ